MSYWKDDVTGLVYDDKNGECLNIDGWTNGKTQISDQEADDILNPPPAPLSFEQMQAAMIAAVQAHMDETAGTHGYDNVFTLVSYVGSTNPTFAAEAQAGLEWRDAVWAYCYQALDDVLSEAREIPTVQELIEELPVMEWPE
ncbi:MAG: hypothetical protein LBE50_03095 [Gallionellaceae bacterium]|jgi:hypothetical protein|nr:hypothetical protein [Gallionellaceae bacterium]